MKRAMTVALAAAAISAMSIGATIAGASVSTKADPQKVCDAIESDPETPKQELAAIRLAETGKNPELTKALAAMETAAQKAVKTKKSGPTETPAYLANLKRVFEFAYRECTDVQVEATFGATGLAGVPSSVEAGVLGVKLTNETDDEVGFGVVRVDDDNTLTTNEIVAAIFASEDEQPEGVEFVGGGGAAPNDAGYTVGGVEPGRYILVVFGEDQSAAASAAEFTVS
jgi:hypothetical protein